METAIVIAVVLVIIGGLVRAVRARPLLPVGLGLLVLAVLYWPQLEVFVLPPLLTLGVVGLGFYLILRPLFPSGRGRR